jgi:hypothetical protein
METVETGARWLVAYDRLDPSCPVCGVALPRPDAVQRPTSELQFVICGDHWRDWARFWARVPAADLTPIE